MLLNKYISISRSPKEIFFGSSVLYVYMYTVSFIDPRDTIAADIPSAGRRGSFRCPAGSAPCVPYRCAGPVAPRYRSVGYNLSRR